MKRQITLSVIAFIGGMGGLVALVRQAQETMSEALVTIIITSLLNLLYWWFQRLINRKTIRIERRKAETDLRKEEFETMASIGEKYSELSTKFVNTMEELTAMKIQMDERCTVLTDELKEVKRGVTSLSSENRNLRHDVQNLQLINDGLLRESQAQKEIAKVQRIEINELRNGISILVTQLREANITPKWQPANGG